MDRPSSYFFNAGSEVCLQSEKLISGSYDTIQTRLVHTDIFKENLFFFIRKIGNFCLNLGAYSNHRSFFLYTDCFNFFKKGIILKAVLFYIGNIHDRFHRQETQLLDDSFLVFREVHASCRFSFIEDRTNLF